MERAWDIEELLALGDMLDDRPPALGGETVGVWLSRTLLRIRSREGKEVPLLPNAAQALFEQVRTERNIVLKARQMGVTTWIAGRNFLRTITRRGVLSVQVAQTREAAESVFLVTQRFWNALPEELKEGPLRLSRANSGQMRFAETGSEFRVLSASDPDAGRGLTIQNLHCSELGHWPRNASDTLAGLRAALAQKGELVLESTPNGAYGCFYEEWLNAKDRGITQHFFPWWMETKYRASAVLETTDEEAALMVKFGLTPEQIGYRRTLEREYHELRLQEFAEDAYTCFRASGDCCFDIAALEQRLSLLPPPVETRREGNIEIWLPPVPGRRYVIAVDTAGGGTDGDFAVAEVLELETGLQCAEVREHLGARSLARIVSQLAEEYSRALVAVERNNHGGAVLAYLEAEYPEVQLYEQGGLPGWLTSAASKPRMVGRLGSLLAEQPWLFRSARLLGECRTFVTLRNGGSGAAPGAHDDCVMAMAIAHAVRAELTTRGAAMARQAALSSILQKKGFSGGSSSSAGDSANARRSSESTDAGSGWSALGGQVPE